MAVLYLTQIGEDTDASDFRESMLILGTMNQFLSDSRLVHGSKEQSRCAEQVLRVALFSKSRMQDDGLSLQDERRRIALAIRTHHRGDLVPVLLGLVWFLFVLALSINFTFENIGENAAGYNLGMGFAVSWIIPLVIGAFIDRNAIATRDLRSNLNRMFALAREALRSLDGKYNQLIDVDGLPKSADLRIDNELLDGLPVHIFADFAGQGRLRWHRDVAHPILSGIQKSYAAEHGRGGFELGEPAKSAMLLPYADEGINVMDRHLLLRIVAAFAIIYGNLGAGFMISYFTPSVGISCRGFGYLVFGISTLVAAILEVVLEITMINVCWLLATVIAQTFNFYQACFCLSAGFDRRGGYIEFEDVENNHSDTIFAVWSISVGVAGSILLGSLAYFVIEWLEQGHLNTFDYGNAQTGLRWSRRFKKIRGWPLFGPMLPVNAVMGLWRLVSRRKQVKRTRMAWIS